MRQGSIALWTSVSAELHGLPRRVWLAAPRTSMEAMFWGWQGSPRENFVHIANYLFPHMSTLIERPE